MITIEIKDANKVAEGLAELEIFCDEEGLKEFQRQLNFLLAGESHIHMATPSWAGHELDEKVMGEGNTIVNQLTIILARNTEM